MSVDELAGGAYLARGFLGEPCWLAPGEERARVELAGDDGDRDAVRAALRAVDEARVALGPDEVCVFLLGYEAAAALDPLAPRKPRDASLGPDAWVRVCARAPAPAGATSADEALPLATAPGAREAHEARVAACREHLYAGTLYQANLAHRLDVEERSRAAALAWFRARTAADEPPFAAYVDDPAWGALVSLSPECFLRWDLSERWAAAWPVKGTRPRGHDAAEDARLLAELRASDKDAAEHVMIVDLLRNDLARVSRAGGVTVTDLMRTLTVRNVHHLETEVRGELLDDVGVAALLEATAPGGSITGAPKSAALDVICELEAGARGPYTGCLGAVDAHGRGAASILIRTWVRPDGAPGALHVGGGIVADSDPADEWRETLAKAGAFGPVRERA